MPDDLMHALGRYIASDILKQPGRVLDPDQKLLSTGLVDSFSLVDLALFVEQQYGVKIDDTELNAQTFDTLRDFTGLVESRLDAGGRG